MKITRKKTALALTGVATAFTLTFGASAAFAVNSGSWADMWVGDEAKFDNGTWAFDSSSSTDRYGGFQVYGSICDTAADGDGVYGEGRVEGYDWSSNRSDGNGSASGCGWENREFYDPAALNVGRGQYQICVDDWGSDSCNTTSWHYRD